MRQRTFFFYASVKTQGLEEMVTSGTFISNIHPSKPEFFRALTSSIADDFPWKPKAAEVIVSMLTLLCED
ncbi:MAG: hypothetical protein HYU74_12440 [Dechloromonas sp.]|nr:hypothetical protein [Dechloromonas sp.]